MHINSFNSSSTAPTAEVPDQYNLTLKPGKEIPLADAHSRAPTSDPLEEEVVKVHNITLHPMKDDRLSRMRSAMIADNILLVLGDVNMKV